MTATEFVHRQAPILIIGDLIIDETWYVDVRKISPEAPVPVAFLSSNQPLKSPGGASLAASYARKHNYPIHLYTASTLDNRKWLESKNIPVAGLSINNNVVKTRYIDTATNYHLLRVDNDDMTIGAVNPEWNKFKRLVETIKPSSILMLDYKKGMFFDSQWRQYIFDLARKLNIPTYVDTKANPQNFKGVQYLKLNEKEYAAACAAHNINNPYKLGKKLDVLYLIVTLGKKGAIIYNNTEQTEHSINPKTIEHFGAPDVTGCGDVFDINFCYYCFNEKLDPTQAMNKAVDKATQYAYMSIGDRLC